MNETLAAMTSILPSELETELRDGAEYSPELDLLMRKARKASSFLKALSHESRLLPAGERERSVTELEHSFAAAVRCVAAARASCATTAWWIRAAAAKTIYYSLANDAPVISWSRYFLRARKAADKKIILPQRQAGLEAAQGRLRAVSGRRHAEYVYPGCKHSPASP